MRGITVIGSYNVGLVVDVEYFPRPGETLVGRNFRETHGGKGSNQAIAARRLGSDVSIISSVGKDSYGKNAISLWSSEKINHDYVKVSDKNTGVGFVIVGKKGENMIVIDPGANEDLNQDDIKKAENFILGSSVVLMQLEIPTETVLYACRLVKKNDVTVILNPAPAKKLGRELLCLIDILTPNEVEFEKLTETNNLEKGCEKLHRAGVKNVVVTLGEKGCYYYSGPKKFYLGTPKVNAVDTTGAGDAFNGALAFAISRGMPWEDALLLSNCAGALSVTKKEVVPSLPTKEELFRFMKKKASHIEPSLNSL